MDQYNLQFSTDPTDLPAGNHSLFDLQAYLDLPLDQVEQQPPVDDYEELMNKDFTARINYDYDYSGESGGVCVDRAILPLSTGSVEQQVAPNVSAIDPAIIFSPAGPVEQKKAPIVTAVNPFLAGPKLEHGGQYLNDILNYFNSPVVPLRIIDEVKYPFEQALQAALERELERENERELAGLLQDALDEPGSSSWRPLRPLAPMKKPGNKRPDNIRNFNAANFYQPLQSRPTSWGSINPETGDQLFQYTEHGELNPIHSFSVAQISEYIGNHPLHYITGVHNTKQSGFTLWIQTVPADSGKRYPEKQSDKCRFADCPDPHRTIRTGQFRVAFDEQHCLNQNTNPYHNAGYVHLYCLEKFLDFPQISKDYNVKPDIRQFREGKNKMAITRDHETMAGLVWQFIAESVPWAQFGTGQRPEEFYRYTLCSRLTDEHLERQPRHLQSVRDQRGGNSIDVHKNNLDLYVTNSKILRANRAAAKPKAAPKSKTPRKRKASALEDEDSALAKQTLKKRVEKTADSVSWSLRPIQRQRNPPRSRTPGNISWTDDFHNSASKV